MAVADFIVVGVVLVAGFVRGVTGFGGAMVMAPPLSVLLVPLEAVVISLLLETAASAVLLPRALSHSNPRMLAYLIVPAVVTLPIGGYLLLTVEPIVTQRAIGAIVVTFGALLLTGYRHHGPPRPAPSVAIGGLVGILLGSTSVGAPPIVFYLLSGPDDRNVTRANLIVVVTILSSMGVLLLLSTGSVAVEFLMFMMLLTIPYLLAVKAGERAFAGMTESGWRRFAIALMLLVGLVALLA